MIFAQDREIKRCFQENREAVLTPRKWASRVMGSRAAGESSYRDRSGLISDQKKEIG